MYDSYFVGDVLSPPPPPPLSLSLSLSFSLSPTLSPLHIHYLQHLTLVFRSCNNSPRPRLLSPTAAVVCRATLEAAVLLVVPQVAAQRRQKAVNPP